MGSGGEEGLLGSNRCPMQLCQVCVEFLHQCGNTILSLQLFHKLLSRFAMHTAKLNCVHHFNGTLGRSMLPQYQSQLSYVCTYVT